MRGSAPYGLAQAGQGFDGTGQPGSAGCVGTKGVPRRFDAKRPCRAGVEQRAWQWKQVTPSTRQDLHGANPEPAERRLDGTGGPSGGSLLERVHHGIRVVCNYHQQHTRSGVRLAAVLLPIPDCSRA